MKMISLKYLVITGVGLSIILLMGMQAFNIKQSRRIVQISDMTLARAAHQATLLPSGEVLITGGCSGNCNAQIAETEIYNPENQTFTPGPAMQLPRASHVAIALNDGQILIAGGWSNGEVTATAEIYDLQNGNFRPVIEMSHARGGPTATLLQNGRVLIAGGQQASRISLSSAEIFDPASSGFILVGSMKIPRAGHASVLLKNGKVLITGGQNARNGKVLSSAEIFDPKTGKFTQTGKMAFRRHKHAAVLLEDGKVLILGGANERDFSGRYQSTEIYDPGSGTFSPGPDMNHPHFKIRYAVVSLAEGEVVVAGGEAPLELFDPVNDVFDPIEGEYKDFRNFSTATALNNGDVLVLGGYDRKINTSAMAWILKTNP